MKIDNFSRLYGYHRAADTAVIATAIAASGTWKPAVRVAATGPIAIATALNPGDALDGVTLADGDRVLVPFNTDASENGIWDVGATPERTQDFDESGEIVGTFVPVLEGTLYAGLIFRNTNTDLVDVDTDDITFELWPPASAGAGDAMVPYYIATDDTFTVPLYKQALFSTPIEIDGALVVNGVLIGVD